MRLGKLDVGFRFKSLVSEFVPLACDSARRTAFRRRSNSAYRMDRLCTESQITDFDFIGIDRSLAVMALRPAYQFVPRCRNEPSWGSWRPKTKTGWPQSRGRSSLLPCCFASQKITGKNGGQQRLNTKKPQMTPCHNVTLPL